MIHLFSILPDHRRLVHNGYFEPVENNSGGWQVSNLEKVAYIKHEDQP
jgi:hypothetical protein